MNGALPVMAPALPEIFLALAAMAMLMLGVFAKGEEKPRLFFYAGAVLLVVTAALAYLVTPKGGATIHAFDGLFIQDGFARFMKLMVLGASAFTLAMARAWFEREKLARFEYPVLIMFAALGMCMMISANDLMSLYLGLELQSLSLYVVAAYHRDNARSTEAGLKYFMLGALASGLLLFGMSLVYGYAGATGFDAIATVLEHGHAPIGVQIGLAFILAGLAFKVAAVPFHMWTPDVYEGAPTPVTAFFAIAPKLAAFALLIRVLSGPFGHMLPQWQPILVLIAILSMTVGAFGALGQTNIKRLMAYSSIGHAGYALVGLAVGNQEGISGVLVYLAIYLAMNMGAFAVILAMRVKGRAVEGIDDLAGLARTNPLMALAMALFMFSMAGIPPLAGFFGKLYVFLAAVHAGLYTLAILGVLTSAVAAFYYLRIVKVMYFDEPIEALDKAIGRTMSVVLTVSTIVVAFFFLVPMPVMKISEAAAKTLFPH
ncbi:MAG: NADH-quinone oxidoreductase subunit NuoN [Rhodospirillales bacterium]|nr:NADH-quinone oxidoreductase subunit NuoN [Rhodospirillales bacterium]